MSILWAAYSTCPSCTNEWTCKCFEDEPVEIVEAVKWGSPISGNHDPLDYPDYYEDPDQQ